MNEYELSLLLWKIYLESCVCHLDYGSSCTCEASNIAWWELQKLLGGNWHGIMRERTKVDQ